MRWRSHQHVSAGKINVTPLIDVVMCLIVFYLLVGKLALDKQGKVVLPTSRVGRVEEAGKGLVINVVVREGGGVGYVINGKESSSDELEGLVRGVGGEKVQVRADRRLTYGQVRPAIEACRKAGLTSVLLTTSKEGR